MERIRGLLEYFRRKLLMVRDDQNNLEVMNLKLPDDFYEKLNKNILFTGAGFSKGFGGLLANELEQYIFNDVTTTSDIKSAIARGNGNYEDSFTLLGENNKIYIKLLEGLFRLIDENILKNNNLCNLKNFMKFFHIKNNYNFIFTSNQDLLLERYAIFATENIKDENNNYIADEPKLSFPYQDYNLTSIVRNNNKCIQNHGKDYRFDDMVETVRFESSKFPSNDMINYIKLHGSWNWNHTEGYVINITGRNKSSSMDTTNILKAGRSIFNEIVKTNLKIVVVGYSFGDPHINDVMFDAINNQSKLIIISPEPQIELIKRGINFEKHKNTKENAKIFFSAITKYYQCYFENFIEAANPYTSNQFNNLKEYLNS